MFCRGTPTGAEIRPVGVGFYGEKGAVFGYKGALFGCKGGGFGMQSGAFLDAKEEETYASPQRMAHFTARCQPLSFSSRRESGMAGVKTLSMAQLLRMSSRLSQ